MRCNDDDRDVKKLIKVIVPVSFHPSAFHQSVNRHTVLVSSQHHTAFFTSQIVLKLDCDKCCLLSPDLVCLKTQ